MSGDYTSTLDRLWSSGSSGYPIPDHIQTPLVKGTFDEKKVAVEELKREEGTIPFGRRIRGAIEKDVDLPRPRGFALHNFDVFRAACDLPSENDPALEVDASFLSEPLTRLFRLAAFLHDIGKALDQARHSTLGWHILVDLCSVAGPDKKDKERLLEALKAHNIPPDAFYNRLAGLVRDHDKFGNLSTGEGSYVLLDSLIQYGGQSLFNLSLNQVLLLWCLNVADIAGTEGARSKTSGASVRLAGQDVRRDVAQCLMDDLANVRTVFERGDAATITDRLRTLSEGREATVERIRRILVARAAKWPGLSEGLTGDQIQAALETHFAPRNLNAFCRDFAMVAKLDYALQFWEDAADFVYVTEALGTSHAAISDEFKRAQKEHAASLPTDWNLAHDDFDSGEKGEWIQMLLGLDPTKPLGRRVRDLLAAGVEGDHLRQVVSKQTDLLVSILRRVVTAYQGLIRGGSVSERAAIGVGFGYLRRDDPEKQRALLGLLAGDGRERGLRWLIDEIASWEMLA